MEIEVLKNPSENTNSKSWKLKNYPHSFTARASEKEHVKLKVLSAKTGLSLSRLVIEGTLSANLLTEEQSETERLAREEMIFQLRRIGVNLNQITSALHALRRGKEVPVTESRLKEVAGKVEALITLLKKKL